MPSLVASTPRPTTPVRSLLHRAAEDPQFGLLLDELLQMVRSAHLTLGEHEVWLLRASAQRDAQALTEAANAADQAIEALVAASLQLGWALELLEQQP